MIKLIPAGKYREHLFENWPSDWPDKNFAVVQHDVEACQLHELKSLIAAKSGERKIESFLKANLEVLSMVVWMFSTGHHMSWLFPKAQIRPPNTFGDGQIPDYLMAGANSDGVSWFVLELKGADKKAFSKQGNRVFLSSEANRGVGQLISYIDACSKDQAYLRDGLSLIGMREPHGILMIGTDDESDDVDVRNFKRAWNSMNPRVQIRSYSSLVRQLAGKLKDFKGLQIK